MKKRVLSLVLCLIMALSLIPTMAFAGSEPITKVEVTGMQTPAAGEYCSTDNITITTTPANAYTVDRIWWYDATTRNFPMSGNTFKAGHDYQLDVRLSPKDGYYFEFVGSNEVYTGVATFNGKTAAVAESYQWGLSEMILNSTRFTAVSKPATPAIASLSNGNTGITVKWSKVTDADGYQIYRKAGSGSWTPAKNITSGATVSWVDGNRTNGTKYQYKVRAYESVGGTKVYGNYSAIKTKYFVAQPKISSITNTSTGITVKWNKITGATAYRVYRKVGTGDWKLLKTVTGTSYTNTGLTNGTKYQYKIVAVKKVDGTNYTSAASAIKTMYRLTRPTISSATNVATKSIKVTWNKNTKVTGYQVKYIKGTTTKTVTVKGASSLTKTLSSLTKGATYKVYVRSYKTVSGTNYYSAWSGYKSVKVAK